MKITKDNFKKFVPKEEHDLLEALLKDLNDVNKYHDKKLYIDWQDWHNDYSCERTDPCPDYYGMFRVRREDNNDYLGVEMTLRDLDISLCLLHNYLICD